MWLSPAIPGGPPVRRFVSTILAFAISNTASAQVEVVAEPSLDTWGRLAGVATDDFGFVVAAATVRVGEQTRVTGDDGTFDFGYMAAGRYEFLIQAPAMERLEGEVRVPQSAWSPMLLPVVDGSAQVTVTAARRPIHARDAIVTTEIVDRESLLRSGARDAAEALEELGNLQIQRTFRGAAISLRGLDPEYTLVLIDGDRQPGATGGAVDLQRYGIENIERIEIVRGPSSALYGSEAIGGVINIITRDSDEPLRASASAAGGSLGRYDFTGFVAARVSDALRLTAGGALHNVNSFSNDTTPLTDGSARRQWSLNGSVRVDPNSKNRIRLSGEYVRTDLQGIDPGAGRAIFDRRQLQERSQTALDYRLERGNLSMRSRATFGTYREQYLLDQRGADVLDRFEDNSETLGQISSVLGWQVRPRHALTFGFEELFQSLRSERLSGPGRRFRLGLFGQYTWTAYEQGDRRLGVAVGARGDTDSQFGAQLSPKLALRFTHAERWSLHASYGRGFRAPSFQELLLRFENPSVGYVVEGNPELGAERSHGVDVGGSVQPAKWLRVEASFFRNDVRGMIATVTRDDNVNGTLFSYDNIDRVWTMGVESSIRFQYEQTFRLQTSYTLTLSETGEGRRLEGRPLHRVQMSANFQHPKYKFGATVRGVAQLGRTYYTDDGQTTAEPLYQLDARVYARFLDELEVFVGADNVADAGDGFTTLQPRTFYGGVRARY
jgi:outer membrane receptor for ferrienterochelin and colicins